MSDTKASKKAEKTEDFGEPLPAPEYAAYGLGAAIDHLKAWMRREIGMAQAGLSHGDREKQNP